MGKITRTTPAQARQAVTEGRALLVCAYEDEATCGKMLLDGALSLGGFRERLATLGKEQEIIFYCA